MQLWGLVKIQKERGKEGRGGRRERDPGGKEGMDGRGEEKGPGGKEGEGGGGIIWDAACCHNVLLTA